MHSIPPYVLPRLGDIRGNSLDNFLVLVRMIDPGPQILVTVLVRIDQKSNCPLTPYINIASLSPSEDPLTPLGFQMT